jgi:hypothetical protein
MYLFEAVTFLSGLELLASLEADFEGVFKEQIVLKNKDISILIGLSRMVMFFLERSGPLEQWTGRMMEVLHIVDFFGKDS